MNLAAPSPRVVLAWEISAWFFFPLGELAGLESVQGTAGMGSQGELGAESGARGDVGEQGNESQKVSEV